MTFYLFDYMSEPTIYSVGYIFHLILKQQGSEVDDSSGMDGENFEPQKKREKKKRKMVAVSKSMLIS